MKNTARRFIKLATEIIFLTAMVSAQSGGTFSIMQSVVAGGGGQNVTAGIFSLDYTLGQSVAGDTASGTPFEITAGFWPGGTAMITGTVIYGNTPSGPPRFISNVLISGTGITPVSALTGFPDGTYALTGFGSGAYTVTPTKTGGVNGITSFDAGKIAQHAAGTSILTGNALIVADVSGNGIVSSFDAAQIALFVVNGSGLQTGTWKFVPVNRSYASVTSSLSGEDFIALLMGEVSGNWTNTTAK